MKICFWAAGSFEKPYASYHLMRDLLIGLLEANHEVWLYQPYYETKTIPQELQKYDNLKVLSCKMHEADKNNFVQRYKDAISYYQKSIKKINESLPFDAAFVQSNFAAYVAGRFLHKKNIPYIYNVQDTYPYNAIYTGTLKETSLVFRILRKYQNKVYEYSSHLITISEDMKDLLIEDGVNADKISVVYNWGYRDDTYEITTECDKRIAKLFPSEKFNVLYAGNIGRLQNVDLIVETAELLRNDKSIHFHVYGQGVSKEKLEQYAKDKGLTNISFGPIQPSELAPSMYMAADLNIIPLLKGIYRCALPSKTATCLACKKPVIFAIGKESGFAKIANTTANIPITESDNPTELMNAILQVKENHITVSSETLYRKLFVKSKNVSKYVDAMRGITR